MIWDRVIVTGGLGFIGSELVKQLIPLSNKILIIDNDSKNHTKNEIDFDKSKVRVVNHDLTKEFNNPALKEADIVFALAACIGGIKYFHDFPAKILRDNNLIMTNTLDQINYSRTKFVYISSSMTMESALLHPTKESYLSIKPVSAYGFSKLSGEEYCKAYADQYGLRYVICRPFNAYGCNEYPAEVGMAHVIPDLILKVLKGQCPLEIFGDGSQIRCYTHVSDIASGIIACARSKAVNDDFNVSVAKPHTVMEVAELIWSKLRKDKLQIKSVDSFKHDVQKRIPDVNKIKSLLGWEAKFNLEDKIDEVIEWVSNVYYSTRMNLP